MQSVISKIKAEAEQKKQEALDTLLLIEEFEKLRVKHEEDQVKLGHLRKKIETDCLDTVKIYGASLRSNEKELKYFITINFNESNYPELLFNVEPIDTKPVPRGTYEEKLRNVRIKLIEEGIIQKQTEPGKPTSIFPRNPRVLALFREHFPDISYIEEWEKGNMNV